MKKSVILLTLIALTFLGCSSDDDSNANLVINQQNLLGKWYLKGGTINAGAFEDYDHDCTTNKDFQEFLNNGSVTFNGYNTACELNDVETSSWVLNGNTLTISSPPLDPMIYEYNYLIESLTTQELVLKVTVNTPEGVEIQRIYATRN